MATIALMLWNTTARIPCLVAALGMLVSLTPEPATAEGRAVYERCLADGLIFSLRREGAVLRFVPPVTTTEAQLDQAVEIVGQALAAVGGAPAGGDARDAHPA